MAACGYCGTSILFGGTRDGDVRFCNPKCQKKGVVASVAGHVPEAIVREQVMQVFRGLCPKCGGSGPVDVHTSHRVWSALIVTTSSSRPHVVCKPCGARAQLGDAVFSLILGWWGFPWGAIMTPVQLFRNIAGLLRSNEQAAPSLELARLVRLQLAADAIAAHQERAA